jgi:hypothetical protein
VFNSIKDGIRRRRRRKSMRLRKGRGQRSSSRFSVSNLGPILKIGGLAVAVAGLVLLVIFVIVPLFGGGSKPTPTPTPTIAASATPAPTPIAKANMSDGVEELSISYQSINDPYVYGREVVFSTGTATEMSPELNTIAIYNLDTKAVETVPDIKIKNNSLFEPKMNDKYIVYLDCKTEYGGAVCAYNRETKENFVLREYMYGKPKVSLSGEYALWMQQTGNGTDKLYLYNLTTRETTVIEELVDSKSVRFSPSAAYMSDDAIIFVEPKDETKVAANSSASTESELRIIPLKEGGDQKSIQFLPGSDVYVYNPMIDGDNVVFMSNTGDDSSNLMLCKKTGETYSTPVMIAENVLNYCVGDGFVAYTKDTAVFIYYFADGSTGQLNNDSTKALLSSANGKDVVWYDITDIEAANVVIYIQVP